SCRNSDRRLDLREPCVTSERLAHAESSGEIRAVTYVRLVRVSRAARESPDKGHRASARRLQQRGPCICALLDRTIRGWWNTLLLARRLLGSSAWVAGREGATLTSRVRVGDTLDRRAPSSCILFLVFTVSGFSGLIYESLWTHYLKLFLGHAAYAQTLVL